MNFSCKALLWRRKNAVYKRCRYLLVMVGILLSTFCIFDYYHGFMERWSQKDFNLFEYPLEIDTVAEVRRLRSGIKSTVRPIENYYQYKLLMGNPDICRPEHKLDLILMVKTSVTNSKARDTIRQTWGNETKVTHQGRIWRIARFFMVGVAQTELLQHCLESEQRTHGDLIQYSFVDTYFNNTIKMISELRWMAEHCSMVPYALFVDDDYFINIRNALTFFHFHSPYDHLYAGNRIFMEPIRTRFQSVIAWRISIKEYPFSRYPPFINAGGFAMTNRSVIDFWLASRYVKFIRFDDVYLGIISWKLNIYPSKVNEFAYAVDKCTDVKILAKVIACHGFKDHNLLHKAHKEVAQIMQSTAN